MSLQSRRERILREIAAGIEDADEQMEEAARAEELARALRAEARETKKVLVRAAEALEGIEGVDRPKPNSRRIAGPAAIAAVQEVLSGVGRTTQSEITKATGKNSGTVTHALRALEEDGMARKTGRRHAGSDEWAWTATKRQRERVEREAAAIAM